MPKSPTPQRLIPNAERLAEHAEAIAEAISMLEKKTIDSFIEIGAHLIAAKDLAGHGHWLVWLDQNFGWSDRTAQRLMQVARQGKSASLSDLNMPISSLYQITARSVPETVRDTVIAQAKTAKMTGRKVVETIAAARPEPPPQAAGQPARAEPEPRPRRRSAGQDGARATSDPDPAHNRPQSITLAGGQARKQCQPSV